MSKIFSEAKIETIDLDEKNNMFSELYNRDKKSVLKISTAKERNTLKIWKKSNLKN